MSQYLAEHLYGRIAEALDETKGAPCVIDSHISGESLGNCEFETFSVFECAEQKRRCPMCSKTCSKRWIPLSSRG